ncbi:MAG TPA: energy transducer TonB [Candidatus Acidoferrum sp.]|jgi:protein TonB|nr:energy transducer TonB [Candidatus Acidoferrum sp.]
MFDNTLNSSWDERSRFGLTTLTSFGLQVLAVGVLLIVPLLRPAGLPLFRSLSTPVSLGRPLGEAPSVAPHAGAHTATLNNSVMILRPSPRLPFAKPTGTEDGPPQVGPSGPYTPGALGPGIPDGVRGALGTDPRPIMPAVPRPAPLPVRVSHMSEGDLVRKVLPTYPSLARSARIQGQVLLQAVISKQGAIENLRVLAGHPMLVPAAIEAVRQWRYRPYVLNNEAVEVETQITVNFSLAGN